MYICEAYACGYIRDQINVIPAVRVKTTVLFLGVRGATHVGDERRVDHDCRQSQGTRTPLYTSPLQYVDYHGGGAAGNEADNPS